MIPSSLRFVLFAMLLSGCAHAAPATASPDFKALLQTQAEDWNRGDLEAFCSLYAEDAAFVSPSGVNRGRAQILARYEKKYDTPEKRGKLSFEFIEVRTQGDSASIMLRWIIKKADSEAAGHSLVVLHKMAKGWRIVQDASM